MWEAIMRTLMLAILVAAMTVPAYSATTERPTGLGERGPSAGKRPPAANPQLASSHDLVALFSGAQAHMTRVAPAGYFDSGGFAPGVLVFAPDGSLSGIYTDRGFDLTDNGVWTVEDGKLCTQWQIWERGEKHCYSISGQGQDYAAGGSSGMLRGAFFLYK